MSQGKPVIDYHIHMLEESVFEASAGKTVSTGFGRLPSALPPPLKAKMLDPKLIVADLDARGIDIGVFSVSTVLQGTSWAEPEADLDYCRRCNDQAARWMAAHPTRLVGSFVLPMQDMALAMGELRRCTEELKLPIANISSSYNGEYLGAKRYHDFWAALEAAGTIAFIHPEGTRDLWFQQYALWNSIGQSVEESKCLASLIYEGVPVKFPKARISIAHGGGYFPHYLGRMDRNATYRPDTLRNTGGRLPSDFLEFFYYDTCVFDPRVLNVLIERVGIDRLLMGSDYPVGERDPVAWLRQAGLKGADLDAVAGGNAARLLGLA